ncbi:MAG: RAD55 family ATPase [Pyrobaculum sp.]
MELANLFVDRVSFVYGPSGSGKTILVSSLAFHFAKEGRKVVWISFYESKETVIETWKAFGWASDKVLIFDFPFVPQYRETLFNQVIDLAYREKAEVLVIDGTDAIITDRAAADAVAKVGVSVIGIETNFNPLGDVADTILRLSTKYTSSGVIRRVVIQKARGKEVQIQLLYLAILPTGPVLLSPLSPPAEPKIAQAPGLLARFVQEMYAGTQIAVYGPYQALSAYVVDTYNAVAYVHKHRQVHFFKKAKTKLVSMLEHMRLEHYAQRQPGKYVITLDGEHIPRSFKRFRSQDYIWIDIYTTTPPLSDYDYVFYVDVKKVRAEHSHIPLAQAEIPLT